MVKFQSDLKYKILDMVELLFHSDVNDLVQMCCITVK